ncbi:isochorismatase family protein [Paenalcaligenes niemegkensis]|uniref:isochorismatase family protein n=1 Tax=Paenalcaligenes niemegkensis TaxID=2895469 RepID=UPI001EE8B7E4|nr:isochorismatase family protein [Paenalcaligenes niemegkensis]MCQ9617123.1 isochorismatase family protein [Paenalcaligenes niemegkensis]
MALLTAHQSVVLVIDLQEKLLPAIDGHEALLQRTQRFITGVRECSVPVIATEHWPDKMGSTHPALQSLIDTTVAKQHFDATREQAVLDSLPSERHQVLLIGAEAHICVLQTGLSLAQAGYTPILVVDVIGSRLESSRQAAIDRWRHHGLEIVNTEMALFEWLETPANPAFKKILPLLK